MLELLAPRPDGASHSRGRAARGPTRLRRAPAGRGRGFQRAVAARGSDPKTVVVFDGQIFNAAEVRAHLQAAGRSLRGNDPGELFAHLYELEGPSGFKRVDGQYGVAIWDGRKQALVLARDPLGVRALYYPVGPKGVAFEG
jgi:asparagine synthase (glutamine-hydrolysing)